jgi:hypothetical protein
MIPVLTRMRAVAAACLSLLLLGTPGSAQTLALLPAVLGTAQFYAADPNSGLALAGRDPVAYQIDGAARGGVRPWEAIWGGVAWRFASEANRAAFLRSPTAFVPRLGGYDAEAAADGRLVEASPDIFLLRSGRLYLFRTEASRDHFKTRSDAAARAEANWQKLQGALVRG